MKLPLISLVALLLPFHNVVAQTAASWDGRFGPPGVAYVWDVAAAEDEFVVAGGFRFDGDDIRRQLLRQDRATGAWTVLADFGPVLDNARDANYVTGVESTTDAVYMAGGFTLGEIRYVARWDRETAAWEPLGNGPGEPVVAVDVTAEGHVYVTGHRHSSGEWTSVVRLWDGQRWTDLGDPLPGYTRDVVAAGGTAFLAFSRIDGRSFRDEVLRWTGSGWESIGRATSSDPHGASLRAVARDQVGSVYAAGRFTALGGTSARSIARWEGERWHALGAGLGETDSATVYSVAAHDGSVYVGGYLYSDDPHAEFVARWNGTDWVAMDEGTDRPVEHLSAVAGGILAGGRFASAGYIVSHGVAWWSESGDAWRPLREETTQGVTGDIRGMAADAHGQVYVVGALAAAGSTVVRNVAVWNGKRWTSWDDRFEGTVSHVSAAGGFVYFSGSFTSVAGQPSAGIAVLDSRQQKWSLPAEQVEGRRIVSAGPVATAPHRLYAAVLLEDDDTPTIALWDGWEWRPLGQIDATFTPHVRTLLADGMTLYVAGTFETVGGRPAKNVARWDGREWASLGDDLGGDLYAVARYGGRLFAGGMLSTEGGVRGEVAEWDGSDWILLSAPFEVADGCEGAALALLSHAGYLYAGGGALACVVGVGGGSGGFDHQISRWDGSNWERSGEVGGIIGALTAHVDDLYVSGNFGQAGDQPALNFGRLRLPRRTADASYFPLAEGNEWTYYETIHPPNAPPDTVVSTPFRVEQALPLDDDMFFSISSRVFGDTLRADSLGRIWSYERGERYLLYDFTLPNGATYTYHDFTVTVRRGVAVETVAGRFENCIELHFDIPTAVDDAWTFVFAPEVGPVVAYGGHGEYARLFAAMVDGRVVSSREGRADPPATPIISAAYPNPFSSTARFTVTLPAAEYVVVALYDVLGREIVRLHDGPLAPGAAHTFAIDDASLAAGVYFLRVKGETFARSSRIVRM